MAIVLSMGIVIPTLQSFNMIINVASLMGSSSLSSLSLDSITSGHFTTMAAIAVVRRPRFASALAFAVVRRGPAPSEFNETRGIFPSAVFWRFAAADPPSSAGRPSLAPAVLPMPILGLGLIFGAIVGAILL
jgi:hypothetical protein